MRHGVAGAERASWLTLAGLAATCAGLCIGHGFTVDPKRVIGPAFGIILLLAGFMVGKARGDQRLAAGAAAFLQMTLFAILGVALAYALAARAPVLRDAELAAIDAALGFDWPAIFRSADSHPLAVWVGGIAYHGLIAQMIGCIVVLAATRRFEALSLAVVAAILTGTLTILVSGIVPAMGNVFDPADYRHLRPSVAWTDRHLITGLRDGTARVLDLGQMTGIVTFPSYHATLTVILAHAVRDVRGLRMAAASWAAVTLLSTPVFGGHYAVDVIGGLIMAAGGIALAPLFGRDPSTASEATGAAILNRSFADRRQPHPRSHPPQR